MKRNLAILFVLAVGRAVASSTLPHHPPPGHWTLRVQGGIISHYNGTGQPVFTVDFCDMLREADTGLGTYGVQTFISQATWHWTPGVRMVGCGQPGIEANLYQTGWYVCPAEASPDCGGAEDYYCGRWGCETIAPWTTRDTELEITRVNSPGKGGRTRGGKIQIKVKTWQAVQNSQWGRGKTWGLRLYVSGTDPGVLFTIQWGALQGPSTGVGPNHFLGPPTVASAPKELLLPTAASEHADPRGD